MGAVIAPIRAASLNRLAVEALKGMTGAFWSPAMTHTYRYRGYEIVPTRQWASWCVSVYATRADLPLLTRSTLRTLAARKEEAVSEAKQSIDDLLARLGYRPENFKRRTQ